MERSNEELLKELMMAFTSLKQKMEDPNYIALDNSIKTMMENQRDMKADVKDLKKKGWDIEEFILTGKGFEIVIKKGSKEIEYTDKRPELALRKAAEKAK